MKLIPTHPLAELFPPMTQEEYDSLYQSISDHGLQHPITLYEGKILDGRHRYKACQTLGISPETEVYRGEDPVGLVLSSNLARRHLSTSQRAAVAAKLADLKIGQKKMGANLRPSMTHAEAGEVLNVSPRTVDTASKLKDEAPKLFKKVESGEVTLNAAAQEVKAKEKAQEKKDDVVRCDTGATIPGPLREMWGRKGEVLAMMKRIATIETELMEAKNTKDRLWSTLDFTNIICKLQNIHQELRAAQLHALCPTCNGRTPDSCKLCKGRGILSKFAWDSFVPEEVRRMKRV